MRMRKIVLELILKESRTPHPPNEFCVTHIASSLKNILALNILFMDLRSNLHKSNTSQTVNSFRYIWKDYF